MQSVSQVLSRVEVSFDDRRSVASAGLMLPLSLAQHLDVESRIDAAIASRGRGGHRNGGAKALTVVSSLLAGGEFISDVGRLGSGATDRILGHRVFSESRCGEWLRSLTGTDIEAISQLNSDLVAQAWRKDLGPDDRRLVLDVDSTHIETHGVLKEGAAERNYRGVRGYHPLICAEASTGQVISAQLRQGNAAPARDAAGFIDETLIRIRATVGSSKAVVLRADSGFYVRDVIEACERNKVGYSITVRQFPQIRQRITNIDADAWKPVSRSRHKRVDSAAVNFEIKGRGADRLPIRCRLIVRRSVTPADTGEAQSRLFDLVDYRAFVTDQPGDPHTLDRFHSRHAVIETVIRDLKYGMALNHMPSGRYHANSGWLHLNILAHNLARWTARLVTSRPITTKTLRHRYLTCPGRITTSSRKQTLHLPARWPWRHRFLTALTHIQNLTTVD